MANRAYLNVMLKQEPLPAHDGNPKRLQRGSIVNLSSGLGLVGMPKNRRSLFFFLIKPLKKQKP
jgi:hypothetical protein